MSNVDPKIFLEYKQTKTKFSVKLKIDYKYLLKLTCSAIFGQTNARSLGPKFLCNQNKKETDQSEVVKNFETNREIYLEFVAGNKEKNTLASVGQSCYCASSSLLASNLFISSTTLCSDVTIHSFETHKM